MLETDAPYMAPPLPPDETYRLQDRGRRNEPWTVRYALRTVAECLAMPEADLERQVAENVKDLFGGAA